MREAATRLAVREARGRIGPGLPLHIVGYSNGGQMQDYWGIGKATRPMLPMIAVPTTAGTVNASEFATAVSQVAIAAGRDDTLPMLTGVRLEIKGDRLTLAATDRYRLAVRELTWNPIGNDAAQVLRD